MKHFYKISELEVRRRETGKSYLEFLRVPAMSAGIYALPAGGSDPQKPHQQDEIYYVIRGRARMRHGAQDQPVAAGSVIFVEAGVEHQFHDIEEELEILVMFAPAET
ncbi:MAG TPA: cupin domain-containing protein [Terriglobales bacterium]